MDKTQRYVADDSILQWDIPSAASKCRWTLDGQQPSPHYHQPYAWQTAKIMPNILYNIGSTPMVRINRLTKEHGLKCELLAKCEFFNSGGSVKDRIALRMVENGERAGFLRPGMTLIEPTSGNTGIGLALVAAVKGYRCVIVMPEKMSQEKVQLLSALGAKIYRTPTSAAYDSPESHVAVAKRLCDQTPNSVILDQYRNLGNPIAHYDQTAEEILHQCDGKLDMVVIGAGTGGSLTGIGRKIKERLPNCIVVGVDPVGSILAADPDNEEAVSFYEVEGIGYDFYPTVLDQKAADRWVKTRDRESLQTARDLIRKEGLLCGGSSGAAMWAALQAAKGLTEGQRCVVLLPDSVRNYMTKFLSDEWMAARGWLPNQQPILYTELGWTQATLDQLRLPEPIFASSDASYSHLLQLVKQAGDDPILVLNEAGKRCAGYILPSMLITHCCAHSTTSASTLMRGHFSALQTSAKLEEAHRILTTEQFIVVGTGDDPRESVTGLLTRGRLLAFIADNA